MSVHKSLSFYTMMQYPPFKKAVEQEDKETFEKIIFEAGIDTAQPYQVVSCEHRPVADKPFIFNGPRVEGSERTDLKYLSSGIASKEAHIDAIQDPTLRATLMSMGREGASDRTWADDNVARKVVQREKSKGV